MKVITLKRVGCKSFGVLFAALWLIAYLLPLARAHITGKEGLVTIYSPFLTVAPAASLALVSLLIAPVFGYVTGITFAAVLNLALRFIGGARLEIQEDEGVEQAGCIEPRDCVSVPRPATLARGR